MDLNLEGLSRRDLSNPKSPSIAGSDCRREVREIQSMNRADTSLLGLKRKWGDLWRVWVASVNREQSSTCSQWGNVDLSPVSCKKLTESPVPHLYSGGWPIACQQLQASSGLAGSVNCSLIGCVGSHYSTPSKFFFPEYSPSALGNI